MSILDSTDNVYTERPQPGSGADAELWDEMEEACISIKTVLAKCIFGSDGCHECIDSHGLTGECPICGRLVNDIGYSGCCVCQCGAALSTCSLRDAIIVCGVAVPCVTEREDAI